jgi:hypothetical protein
MPDNNLRSDRGRDPLAESVRLIELILTPRARPATKQMSAIPTRVGDVRDGGDGAGTRYKKESAALCFRTRGAIQRLLHLFAS